ncbi:unnamed protein product [Calicophoron daubneyi]|uniref:Uncharacterized protein n=1 Tax=Calicophoron daubneyi TaxID=300641 RepID=A0AAV2TCL2_CALDB
MTSIADYMKSPSSRPYYVLIGSLSIAIYMIITGLAADSKIFNSYASSTDKGMGGLQIVALSLLAVALAFTAAAVCCPKLRKTFHVVVFSTLAAASSVWIPCMGRIRYHIVGLPFTSSSRGDVRHLPHTHQEP